MTAAVGDRCRVRLVLGARSSEAWPVEVPLWLPARQLARRLLRETGGSGEGRLMLRGVCLPDGATLGDVGVEPDSLLRLLRLAPLATRSAVVEVCGSAWERVSRWAAVVASVALLGASAAVHRGAHPAPELLACLGLLTGWCGAASVMGTRGSAGLLVVGVGVVALGGGSVADVVAWALGLLIGASLQALGALGPVPPARARGEVRCAICGFDVAAADEVVLADGRAAHRICVQTRAAAQGGRP